MQDICALCTNLRELVNSHIIPEFLYRPLYDEKHRAITFSPLDIERYRYEQKGVRSRLLCVDCEGRLNDWYEKPFLEYWQNGRPLNAVRRARAAILRDVPYATFKLFHLSVLFRAAASDHPNFAEVRPGMWVSELRELLQTRNAGDDQRYAIVCTAMVAPDGELWGDFVGPAHSVRLHGSAAYYFAFGGAQWLYFIDPLPDKFAMVRLRDNGRLPIARQPYVAIRHYKALLDRQA